MFLGSTQSQTLGRSPCSSWFSVPHTSRPQNLLRPEPFHEGHDAEPGRAGRGQGLGCKQWTPPRPPWTSGLCHSHGPCLATTQGLASLLLLNGRCTPEPSCTPALMHRIGHFLSTSAPLHLGLHVSPSSLLGDVFFQQLAGELAGLLPPCVSVQSSSLPPRTPCSLGER